MLNEIIQELEAKGIAMHNKVMTSIEHEECSKYNIQLEVLREAIDIIKKHESEFKEAIKLHCIEILDDTISDFDIIDEQGDELLWQLSGTSQTYNSIELYDYLTNKPI
jgi:regulator of RNase E activity RraB